MRKWINQHVSGFLLLGLGSLTLGMGLGGTPYLGGTTSYVPNLA